MPQIHALLAQAQPEGILGLIDRLARTPLSQVVIFVAVCSVIRFGIFPYLLKTPQHLRSGLYTGLKFLNEFLDAVIYAGVFVFLIIRPFLVQTFYIPSGSMVQTLQVKDYIIANKLIYRYTQPQTGDIVVFKPPKRALRPDQGETDFIKRLQGTPGDLVEVKDDVLYRNGKKIEESYKAFTRENPPFSGKFYDLSPEEMALEPKIDFKLVKYKGELIPLTIDKTSGSVNDRSALDYQIPPTDWETVKSLPAEKIPAGMYLFMGDNRNNSSDGRFWGLVPRNSIIGRSEFIWLPFNRWRMTR